MNTALRVTTVSLDPPLTVEGQTITEVVLREPPFDAVIQLGEPWTVSTSPDGAPIVVDNPEAMSAYLDVCLISPPRHHLAPGGVRVARAVKKAVDDFFLDGPAKGVPDPKGAPEADAGSTTSPTT